MPLPHTKSILHVTNLDPDRPLAQSMSDTYFEDHGKKKCKLSNLACILERASWDGYDGNDDDDDGNIAHCGPLTLDWGKRQMTSGGDWCAWFLTKTCATVEGNALMVGPAEYVVFAIGHPARIPWPKNMPRPIPENYWIHDEWESSNDACRNASMLKSLNGVPVYKHAFHGDIIKNVGLHTRLRETLEDLKLPAWSKRWSLLLGYDSLNDIGERLYTPTIQWSYTEDGMWNTTCGGLPWGVV